MVPMLEASGLRKHFGDVRALDGLDLVADAGQVFAILGPNGAGKTTFIRAIATLTRLDAGTLRVAGIDVATNPRQVRRAIGLAGQYAAVEPALTGRENLRMVARLFGHDARSAERATEVVLEQLGLTDACDRLVRTYSGGMRRRLDLGASLVGAPKVLLLDEPTTGLDPRSRTELWAAIEDLASRGTDVVLTTQYLDEADRLADTIAIIDHGRLVASGTSDELKARLGRDVVDVKVRDHENLAAAAAALGPEATVDRDGCRVSLPVTGGPEELVAAIQALGAANIELDDVALRRPTLDDVFLALTGHKTTPTPEVDADQDADRDADQEEVDA